MEGVGEAVKLVVIEVVPETEVEGEAVKLVVIEGVPETEVVGVTVSKESDGEAAGVEEATALQIGLEIVVTVN